jgi:ABC-2 type transport system ATP-binding protein
VLRSDVRPGRGAHAGGVIEVEELTRRDRGRLVLDRVSFSCRPGRVTGLIGPTGAGKTTVLRVLAGLCAPTTGEVTVGGLGHRELVNPGRHVGVLLGTHHPGRTGREALTLGARTMGLPRPRVAEVLDLVGLTEADACRRVRRYPPAAVRRLGVAYALLGDPEVLVLDEPGRGLDPDDTDWLRDLLTWHARRGGTALVTGLDQAAATDDLVHLRGGQVVTAPGAR